jgi:hypothetical protein
MTAKPLPARRAKGRAWPVRDAQARLGAQPPALELGYTAAKSERLRLAPETPALDEERESPRTRSSLLVSARRRSMADGEAVRDRFRAASEVERPIQAYCQRALIL